MGSRGGAERLERLDAEAKVQMLRCRQKRKRAPPPSAPRSCTCAPTPRLRVLLHIRKRVRLQIHPRACICPNRSGRLVSPREQEAVLEALERSIAPPSPPRPLSLQQEDEVEKALKGMYGDVTVAAQVEAMQMFVEWRAATGVAHQLCVLQCVCKTWRVAARWSYLRWQTRTEAAVPAEAEGADDPR